MADSNIKIFAGLTAAAAVSMLGVGVAASRLPALVINLSGGDASLVGLLASCFALPYIFLQVPLGSLSDRYGFKPFLMGGYCLSALSGIIFYAAGSCAPIFVGRAVQGAGEIPVWALAPALISIAYPEKKGRMIGIYTAATYVMLTVGPLLVPCFPGLFGERGGFLFFSALCLTAALIIFFTQKNHRPEPGSDKQSLEIRKAFELLRDLPVRIALFGIFLYGCGQGLLFSIAPGWLVTARGYDGMDIGLLFSAYYICIAAAQLFYGPMSDRYGRKIFMALGLACTAFAWTSFPYAPKPAAIALLGVTAGSLGGFFVASMAFLNERAPDRLKGTISGAYYLFWGVGYFLGPIAWGFGGSMFGMQRGFILFGALLALAATSLASVKIPETRYQEKDREADLKARYR